MKRFKEKTVIVTGAGSGIGRATAIRFAHEGANVVLVGSTAKNLEETAKAFPQDRTWIHTDNYLKITCDISVQNQVQEMIKQVLEKFEKIDVLVNHADSAPQGKITELSAEGWKSLLDMNLNVTSYVCQTAMPYLVKTRGNIINVSSLVASVGNRDTAIYNAAKAGVNKLTGTLALEHGSDGVRVNAVTPNVTDSNTNNTIQNSEATSDEFLPAFPLGRRTTPEDIAAAITFLASDDAAMITGVNLPVDGGFSISNDQSDF